MRLVIDVGANRPDLLSHLGVAREIAALVQKPLGLPAIEGLNAELAPAASNPRSGKAAGVDVRVDDADLVRRFMGVVIRGVSVGPSPEWLVQRLASVGARSINNVVDASNYVLHELGQPTHTFDLAKLQGSSVVVRRARAGERITTLDGAERVLGDQMVVIADAERPQAIAGIMGGADSEVSDSTTDVFLEVANFNPRRIRDARRSLALSTDASYRFERGVDVELAPIALQRVAQLIVSLAGGRVDGAPVDLGHQQVARSRITLRPSRVTLVLGDSVAREEIVKLLQSIGFGVELAGDALAVVVPPWRGDVTAEIDLIEEIARLRGYDSFPTELRPSRPSNTIDGGQWMMTRALREDLVSTGLLEVRPMPFVAGGEGYVRLVNPLSENESYLRRDVLETLGRRAEFNLARMNGDIRIFEIGSVFTPRSGKLPYEEVHAAAVVMGRRQPPHFSDPKSAEFEAWSRYGEWDAKALAELMTRSAFPTSCIELVSGDKVDILWDIKVDDRRSGSVCRLTLDAPVWAAPAFGIELSLGAVESAEVAPPGKSAYASGNRRSSRSPRYRSLPVTPAAEFDLALLVPDGVRAERIEALMKRVSGKLLERVVLFDRYVGRGVESGHSSLAWRLTFRHPERTLRDREIDARRAEILKALGEELHVRQRTT
jgi:phenylalanyl-tRNA synthetase beta chain